MPVPDLEKLDTAPIEYTGMVIDSDPEEFTDFSNEFKRWLSNVVDVFNENMGDIEAELASLDARITALGG